MNRHERRKAKAGRKPGFVVNISFGRCLMAGESKVECFACGNEAKDWNSPGGPALLGYGLAEIQEGDRSEQVPICESCFSFDEAGSSIVRKWLNAPDLKITEGGEATAEHVANIASALSEKDDATKH